MFFGRRGSIGSSCVGLGDKRKTRRGHNGQGLIEGAVGLCLVLGGVALGALLLMCTGYATAYKGKLAYIAHETAAYVQGRATWLGCTRPEYNASTAQADATEAANLMLQEFGLPAGRVTCTPFQKGTYNFYRVTITVDRLRIPGGGILPSFIKMSETGISVDHAGNCWGFAGLTVYDQDKGTFRVVYFPMIGTSALNQHSGTPRWLNCAPRPPYYSVYYDCSGRNLKPVLKNLSPIAP